MPGSFKVGPWSRIYPSVDSDERSLFQAKMILRFFVLLLEKFLFGPPPSNANYFSPGEVFYVLVLEVVRFEV